MQQRRPASHHLHRRQIAGLSERCSHQQSANLASARQRHMLPSHPADDDASPAINTACTAIATRQRQQHARPALLPARDATSPPKIAISKATRKLSATPDRRRRWQGPESLRSVALDGLFSGYGPAPR